MVVKTLEEARKHFEDAIPLIPDRYEAGASKAIDIWYTRAKSDQAEANYKAMMTKVLAEGKRKKGIEALGSGRPWFEGVSTKGKPVIGDRIRNALDKWQAKWGPMYDAIVKLLPTLPPKTVSWEENIEKRLKAVVKKWKEVSGKL